MLQWFLRLPEFAKFNEFNENSIPFSENSIGLALDMLLSFGVLNVHVAFIKVVPKEYICLK